MKVDGIMLTYPFTDTAFFFLQVKAAFIDIGNQRNGLGEVNVDRFIRRQILIVWVRDLHRAVFHTGGTARALILNDVSGLCGQGDVEVPYLPFYTVNFGIRQNLYVGMPADLDQFGGENSHRAVVRGVGLVQLSHMAANGGGPLNEIDLIAGFGQIQSALDAADTTPDNHYIAEIAIHETAAKLFDLFSFHLGMSSSGMFRCY